MIETIVRTKGGAIRALRFRKLNGMVLATLLMGKNLDSARKTAPAIVSDPEAVAKTWRAACDSDGFTEETTLP